MKTFKTNFRGSPTTWEVIDKQGNALLVVRKDARPYGLPSRSIWVMLSDDGEYKTCRGAAFFSLGETL